MSFDNLAEEISLRARNFIAQVPNIKKENASKKISKFFLLELFLLSW